MPGESERTTEKRNKKEDEFCRHNCPPTFDPGHGPHLQTYPSVKRTAHPACRVVHQTENTGHGQKRWPWSLCVCVYGRGGGGGGGGGGREEDDLTLPISGGWSVLDWTNPTPSSPLPLAARKARCTQGYSSPR